MLVLVDWYLNGLITFVLEALGVQHQDAVAIWFQGVDRHLALVNGQGAVAGLQVGVGLWALDVVANYGTEQDKHTRL